MKRAYLIGFMVIAAIGGYFIGTQIFGGHKGTSDLEPAFEVTSDAIVQDFLDNQHAASEKYIDQVIEVSGPLFNIEKENGKVTSVMLSTDEMYIVNASFQEPQNPENISEDQLAIKGICAGFNGDAESMLPGGVVELKRAVIITE